MMKSPTNLSAAVDVLPTCDFKKFKLIMHGVLVAYRYDMLVRLVVA
jgi:hypothetical protein